MTKPAGQEAAATQVRPAPAEGDDPFGFSPWLREAPSVAIPPLMAHPVAAMAAATAIGVGLASHFTGIVLGVMQGAVERAKEVLDEAEAKATVAAARPDTAPVVYEEAPSERPGVMATAAAVGAEKEATPARMGSPLGQAKPKGRPATVRKGSGSIAGVTDDLKRISGVGPKLEQVLNGNGIFRFADVARWTASDVGRIEAELGLDGRIARDGWVEQAKTLAKAKG